MSSWERICGRSPECGAGLPKSALLLTGLVALALARPAAAQNSNLFRVNVPFSFTAGQLAFPAGDYRINVDTDHGVVTLG